MLAQQMGMASSVGMPTVCYADGKKGITHQLLLLAGSTLLAVIPVC